jgi:hypothetical protein
MSKVEQSPIADPISLGPYVVNLTRRWIKETIMNLPQQVFVNVSGIDPNDGATIVFAWCRNKGPEDYVLLGSGHIVNIPAHARPHGIRAGQYSVTFLLPPGSSADDVFVTDDKSGSERLTGVTIAASRGNSGAPLEVISSVPDDPAGSRISPAFRNSATLNRGN